MIGHTRNVMFVTLVIKEQQKDIPSKSFVCATFALGNSDCTQMNVFTLSSISCLKNLFELLIYFTFFELFWYIVPFSIFWSCVLTVISLYYAEVFLLYCGLWKFPLFVTFTKRGMFYDWIIILIWIFLVCHK